MGVGRDDVHGESLADSTLYREIVGSLNYVMTKKALDLIYAIV